MTREVGMIRRIACIAALGTLVALTLLPGCGGKGRDRVIARVGSVEFTAADVDRRLAELPPYVQQQFAGLEGRKEFLDRLIEEEVMFQAARQAGYETNPDVTRAVEAVKRRTMIQAYYADAVEKAVQVPEDEVVAYYDEHDEQFQRRPHVKFRHIMTKTRAEAAAARARVLAGEDFASVARDVSIDPGTKQAGGLTRPIALGDGLPSAGMSPEFIESLFDWKVGEVTDPLQSDKGWHVIRIEEKEEGGTKPLEEVHEQIVRSLTPIKTREYYEVVLEGLKRKLKASVDEQAFEPTTRSEEELFTLAQETEDPVQRLGYYGELVMGYPEGEHADEAQFMIGFIQAEELHNYDAARNAFERLLEKYPDSELKDSANWMLENMGKETPPFDDSDIVAPS
jgi:peptidyl-prolyl cis-trans isomerase C